MSLDSYGELIVWDIAQARQRARIATRVRSARGGATFVAGGSRIVAEVDQNTIATWDLDGVRDAEFELTGGRCCALVV